VVSAAGPSPPAPRLGERGFDRSGYTVRGFQLRVVADVVEGDDAKARNAPSGVVGDLRARPWIGHAPDEAGRDCGSFERTLPTRGVRSALVHVAEELRYHRDSVSPLGEFPLLMELCRARLMVAREHR